MSNSLRLFRWTTFALGLLGLGAQTACKREVGGSTSETRSLEDLASGNHAGARQCKDSAHGLLPTARISGSNPANVEAAKSVVAARVPMAVQKVVFGLGEIKLVGAAEIERRCAAVNSRSTSTLASCRLHHEDRYEILVLDDRAQIEAVTVATMAIAFAEAAGGPQQLVDVLGKDFVGIRPKVTGAFLMDFDKQRFDWANLQGVMPKAALAPGLSPSERIDILNQAGESGPIGERFVARNFDDIVLANALDTAYCGAPSKFDQTLLAAAPLLDALAKLSDEQVAALTSAESYQLATKGRQFHWSDVADDGSLAVPEIAFGLVSKVGAGAALALQFDDPGYGDGGFDQSGGGYDPYGGGYDPNGGGYDPNGGGYDPNGGGYDPNGADSSGMGTDPGCDAMGLTAVSRAPCMKAGPGSALQIDGSNIFREWYGANDSFRLQGIQPYLDPRTGQQTWQAIYQKASGGTASWTPGVGWFNGAQNCLQGVYSRMGTIRTNGAYGSYRPYGNGLSDL